MPEREGGWDSSRFVLLTSSSHSFAVAQGLSDVLHEVMFAVGDAIVEMKPNKSFNSSADGETMECRTLFSARRTAA